MYLVDLGGSNSRLPSTFGVLYESTPRLSMRHPITDSVHITGKTQMCRHDFNDLMHFLERRMKRRTKENEHQKG